MNEQNIGCLERAVDKVRDFHKAFNHPHPDKITKLDDTRKKIRAKWMMEEIEEFLDANTIHEEMDAMADLCFFLCGTVCESGITGKQFSHIFDLVQEANMSKLWEDGKPHYNADNKVIKPKGWIAPDEKIKEYIESLIRAEDSQVKIFDEQ